MCYFALWSRNENLNISFVHKEENIRNDYRFYFGHDLILFTWQIMYKSLKVQTMTMCTILFVLFAEYNVHYSSNPDLLWNSSNFNIHSLIFSEQKILGSMNSWSKKMK